MTAVELNTAAPRLSRAYRQQQYVERARSKRRRWLTTKLLETERVVEHRELQLIRAMHTESGRYIARRHQKLASAKARLAYVKRLIDEVDTWEPDHRRLPL